MKKLLSIIALLGLSACATPMTTDEISEVRYNCSNVSAKVATLKTELEENNDRAAAGVRSVLPIAAVVNVARGRYAENVKISTGEWAEILEGKIAEMESFKANCS